MNLNDFKILNIFDVDFLLLKFLQGLSVGLCFFWLVLVVCLWGSGVFVGLFVFLGLFFWWSLFVSLFVVFGFSGLLLFS